MGKNGRPTLCPRHALRWRRTINEMFEIDGEDGQRLLCVVRKIDQTMRVYYKLHTDARSASEIKKDNLSLFPEGMRKNNARKFTIDPLGRKRWAHD